MKNRCNVGVLLANMMIPHIFDRYYHHISSFDFPGWSTDIQRESMNVIPHFDYNVEKAVIVTYDILQFRRDPENPP